MQHLRKPRYASTSSPNPEVIQEAYEVPSEPSLDELTRPDSADGAESAQRTADSTPLGARTVNRAGKPFHIDQGRYLQIVWFFGRLFALIILWEVVIRRIAGSSFVARGRSNRSRRWSRGFRKLATQMGGVMIKLGQFVSSRVDVLPPEITQELEGLQDQVPIVPFDYIKATIEKELGPIDQRFLWLNPEPVAAASFGQVHRAQLHTGDRVVVKVQRPAIDDIVHTDLAALAVVARIAMRYGPIRRRANVPELLEEFSRVLWEELDYLTEADHALTFASIFKDDPGIYIPNVYLDHTSLLVLTLEDVTSIKITDYAALESAGINRKEVAKRLLDCYLRQIFIHRFFHADPHPGNIFVYPLPQTASEPANGKRTNGSGPGKNQPFYIVFIDFGMVGRLTPRLMEGLRETLIAVATRDAKGLVQSYKKIGVLLPSANVERVEDATRAVFDKVWGLNMSELGNMSFEDMSEVAHEFSDLLLSMPFQMPQDFIYLSRAVGILSGMCTGLDATFDPWREMGPFTQRLLEESSDRTKGALSPANPLESLRGLPTRASLEVATRAITDFMMRAYKLPALAEDVVNRANEGKLVVRVVPDDRLDDQMSRIETATRQMTVGIVFAAVTVASTLLYVNHEQGLGIAGYVLAGVTLLMMIARGRE